MKTLPPLAFLAAFVAFVIFPLPFEIAGSLLIAAALGAIAVSDYSRARHLRRVHAGSATPMIVRLGRERLRLAA